MNWRRLGKSLQALMAHNLLLAFTILLMLKLDQNVNYSWWIVFLPLWIFHAVVARGRFSLPAPSVPHDRHWAPCHAIVATPLLIASELLLCIYLESIYAYGYPALSLKILFLPLLAFEMTILVDNFRMCKALLPGDDEGMSDEAICEALPHFWVAISMILFVAATVLTLLKLSGDVGSLSWWDLLINFGLAECFAFLVCTKWSNPVIHTNSHSPEGSSSSTTTQYLDWNSGLVVSEDYQSQEGLCGLAEIGGHIMKIPFVAFQILLCMRLEGTPSSAKRFPLVVFFSPLFLLQGVGVLLVASRFTENLVIFIRGGSQAGRFFAVSSRVYELFEFLHRGSRLLGWWSVDEASREEQSHLCSADSPGYNTFCKYPPEVVKKMPKKDLAEEVWRLQAALGEQSEITKFSQQEYERLQSEKVSCRVCFDGEISVVLLPCRHRILCSACSERCKKCPICRALIEERLQVYDV
ncbi:hypothetical protein Leryth_001313 [Lithospermum erythrorhizon]|nr:hypothetical protein Leryth_001313 [Lithospermum erythrorhizon]